MPKAKKTKYYGVAKGRETGVYKTWDDCKKQVNNFSKARFKSFGSQQAADKVAKYSKDTVTNDRSKEGHIAAEKSGGKLKINGWGDVHAHGMAKLHHLKEQGVQLQGPLGLKRALNKKYGS